MREVERGSFTPLVFSLGRMGKAATVMYRRLANLLRQMELSLLFDYGLAPMFSKFLPATFPIDVPSKFPL